ncbi:MAG: hypothetical protein RJQ07_00850 [Pseudomonadales bacterium]
MPRHFDTTDLDDDFDGVLSFADDDVIEPPMSKMAQKMKARRQAEEWWEARLLQDDEWDLGYRFRRNRRRHERDSRD